jgi:hypothetical protein
METKNYHIRVRGHLDDRWFHWFDGLTLDLMDDGETLITCAALDSAALHALLNRIRDLGLELISAQQVGVGE